ncbi:MULTISPECIES: efflux RND transporter periplasmic adaptor subunit [Hymenobacter]|jgi:Cu(I)/Ag(I) efflux system membrane fusion protein|uniref:Efflux RND transporter periplasmic adaptor subunit n=1 Tax=Hymenobacter fodinae TaxID=2510796 RepID=A0A4Z0NYY5_9BACT|nr:MULTISPECIES: efflux RND transporter periplasmic adaptor subunit [Hymenobacter]TGE03532.1 efflux RND transporter periplasmic adaptor subunit [Hymenobacter fodinae]
MTRNWSNKLRCATWCVLVLALLAGCKGKAHGPAAQAPAQPEATAGAQLYTCSMHPQIVRDAPGQCPICGMDLVPKANGEAQDAADTAGADLDHLVTSPNGSVVSAIATVRPTSGAASDTLSLPGVVDYDPRRSRAVAARVGGRIERLLVRFNYQPVRKGQTLLELYSPELVTAEQEYIFLLGNDADNTVLVNGARQKLRLLGLSEGQLRALARTRRPDYRVAVFSPYDGYVVENTVAAASLAPPSSAGMPEASAPAGGMGSASAMSPGADAATATAAPSAPTPALTLQEGGYVSTGQTLFQVVNTAQVWGLFQPGPGELGQMRPGQMLQVTVPSDPTHSITARVELVEPTYRAGASTPAVRVSLPNPRGLLRRGTRLTARLSSPTASGWWLPRAAVVDLGTRQVAFVRRGRTFVPVTVLVGQRTAAQVQIRQGLSGTEAVAANGQYLVDSESFLQTSSTPSDATHE